MLSGHGLLACFEYQDDECVARRCRWFDWGWKGIACGAVFLARYVAPLHLLLRRRRDARFGSGMAMWGLPGAYGRFKPDIIAPGELALGRPCLHNRSRQ